MPIFTTEIAGKPTVAFAARDYAHALAFVHTDFLRSELRDLRAPDGAPLWDGQANLVVRDATEEEKSAWEAEVALAIRERARRMTPPRSRPMPTLSSAVRQAGGALGAPAGGHDGFGGPSLGTMPPAT